MRKVEQMKDKRTKCCPNEACEHNLKRKKHKYAAEDSFCKACGSELVYVCSKCFGPLADEGPEHKLCKTCEARAKDKKDHAKATGKKVAGGAGAVAVAAATFVKSDGVKIVKDVAKRVIKK